MTPKISNKQLEDLQDAGAKQYKRMQFELDFDKISIRELSQEFDEKNQHRISRELVAERGNEEFVILGYEYDANGQIGDIYQKKQKTGAKIPLTVDDLLKLFGNLTKTNEMESFIKERMDNLMDTLSKNKKSKQEPQAAATPVKEAQTTERKVRRTEVSKETASYIKSRGARQTS